MLHGIFLLKPACEYKVLKVSGVDIKRLLKSVSVYQEIIWWI